MSLRRPLTDNLSARRGRTDNLSRRRPLTDNLSVRRAVTDNLLVRRALIDNLSLRRPLIDNLSVRRGLTENLSVTRGLTDNLSIRRGRTDNFSVRRSLTDNLLARRGLTDNLSVRRGLTDNFSSTYNFPHKGSLEDLSEKQITSIAMNTVVIKKRATKHWSWRLCKSNSYYPESIPVGTHFIRFAIAGKVKNGMTEWEKNKQNELTEKAKKWVHSCGRKRFTIDKISKDTYSCLLSFVGGNGPTEEDPDPINSALLRHDLVRENN